MAKWALVIEANCADPSREAELNDWYHNIHIHDTLESPGFIKGTRYEFLMPWKITGGGENVYHITDTTEKKAEFLVVIEIEADDPVEAMKIHDRNMDKKGAEGRLSDLVEIVSMSIYKQISSVSK